MYQKEELLSLMRLVNVFLIHLYTFFLYNLLININGTYYVEQKMFDFTIKKDGSLKRKKTCSHFGFHLNLWYMVFQ